MNTTLIMVFNSIQGTWTDILNAGKSEGKNLDTVEKATAHIDVEYGAELGERTYDISEDEIYAISENPISPCVNCP